MQSDLARTSLGAAAALAASALLLSATAGDAAPLTVAAEGVRSARGVLRVGVYDAANRAVATRAVPAVPGRIVVDFEVPAGSYAVKLHHDEDGDGRLATGPFGIPREGYGFSNRARAVLGVPSFDKMRVDVGPAPASTAATLRY